MCLDIFIYSIRRKQKIVTCKDGRKLIGFSGYSKDNSKKHLLKKVYENNYDYLPKELENYFDGEVSILIVDKDYRGKNIGKKLLLEVFNLAKKDNMKNLQILTDESCNFKFYENCGCEKIYETIVKNQDMVN